MPLAANFPTLLDVTSRVDPKGNIPLIAELLHQTNEIIPDIPWMEGNLATGHRSMIRTGLPSTTWRKFYGGVQPDKSTTATIVDSCAMLRAYHQVDAELLNLSPSPEQYRMTESIAQLESMAQAVVTALFFGDASINPEQFNGLYPRYNSSTALNGKNIIKGGGAGSDNASIWIIQWGMNSVFGIYPRGSTGGLNFRDLGEDTEDDGNGGKYQVVRSYFGWDCGLVVSDWRRIVRICNIDRSALLADASSGANLPDLIMRGLERLPSMSGGYQTRIYMDRDLKFTLGQQMAYLTKNSTLSQVDVGGVMVDSFKGVPIRRVDALYADEATVA